MPPQAQPYQQFSHVYRNPQTGESVGWNGKSWVPMGQTPAPVQPKAQPQEQPQGKEPIGGVGGVALGVGKSLLGGMPFMTQPMVSSETQKKAESLPVVGGMVKGYREMQEAASPHGMAQQAGFWGSNIAQFFLGGGESTAGRSASEMADAAKEMSKVGSIAKEDEITTTALDAAKGKSSELYGHWAQQMNKLEDLVKNQFVQTQAIQKYINKAGSVIKNLKRAGDTSIGDAQNIVSRLQGAKGLKWEDIKPLMSDIQSAISSSRSNMLRHSLGELANAINDSLNHAAHVAGVEGKYQELQQQYRALKNWQRAYARIVEGKSPGQLLAKAGAKPSRVTKLVGLGEVGVGAGVAAHEPAFGAYVAARGAERIAGAEAAGKGAAVGKVSRANLERADQALEYLRRNMGLPASHVVGRAPLTGGSAIAAGGASREVQQQ